MPSTTGKEAKNTLLSEDLYEQHFTKIWDLKKEPYTKVGPKVSEWFDAEKGIGAYVSGNIEPPMIFREVSRRYLISGSYEGNVSEVRGVGYKRHLKSSVYFSKKLTEIEKEIERSKYILSLEDGWDQDSAVRIDVELYNNSTKFLREYAQYIYTAFGIAIVAPEINPVKNGSIDLSWRSNGFRLLINFKLVDGEILAYFYGDRVSLKPFIKGVVLVDTVDETLATWMKQLTT